MAVARKDKGARDRQLLAKRRAGFTAVLRKLGVEREFERLPLTMRNRMYLCRVKPARVMLDGSAAAGSRAPGLKREIEGVLDLPLVDFAGNGELISFNEAWSVVLTLQAYLGSVGRPQGLAAEVGRAMGRVCSEDVFSLFGELGKDVGRLVWFEAMRYSRIDERTYSVAMRSRGETDPFGGGGRDVILYATEPRRRTFGGGDGGAARPAYQVCSGTMAGTSFWVEWDAAKLGLAAPAGTRLPVYVQGHAMQRLVERMPGERGEDKRQGLHMLMCESLLNAEIVRRDGDGRYWVALRDFRRQRLGYFLAEVVDGAAVLVRTFQTLTMHGSPEASRLYQRLGARRGDFEHLRLDELATFLESDLAGDEELRGIFEECGCGHLFELRKQWGWTDGGGDDGTAQWVRKYFELGPARGAAA
jgi:hypothetical protein